MGKKLSVTTGARRLSLRPLVITAMLVAGFAITASGASAVTSVAAASGGKLTCVADPPATCTLNSATSATIDTTAGGDAFVFLSNRNRTNVAPVANVVFSFTYFCSTTTDISQCTALGAPPNGAPQWNIPINTDGNKRTTEGFATIDGQGCLNNGTPLSGGALTVSTTVATCPVTFETLTPETFETYANWDAFAAANPTFTLSADGFPVVFSDVQTAAASIVSNVVEQRT